MQSKISIIIVTYNSSKNIAKLLKSIVSDKRDISEVIIIENNSPDKQKTKKICDQFKFLINIKYISRNNVGFGKSCNYGARTSKSKNILFLNPDTELKSNSIKILLRHMRHTRADIIGGKAFNYDSVVHRSVVRIPSLLIGLFEFSNLGKIFNIDIGHKLFYYEDIKILDSHEDMVVDAVSGAYLLVSKKAFNILHGFDENIFMYLEDVDLGKRAKDLGMKVVYCPHSEIWHIGGASSNNVNKIRHQAWFDSRKYYFRKHFGIITNLMIQSLYTIEEYLLKLLKHL